MNVKRLTNIISSKNEKNGLIYKGHPIWIEALNSNSDTVQVKLLDLNESRVVQINEIKEE